MTDRLSWTPVRRGPVYCSPACGGGCTRAAYDAAREAAADLARDLGPGWAPHVWENLGWHYAAQRGSVSVRRANGRSYYAFDEALAGALPQHGYRPWVAVDKLRTLVRELLDDMEARYAEAFGEEESDEARKERAAVRGLPVASREPDAGRR